MTAPTTRVLVTTPDGREFVTAAPLVVADTLFPRNLGYELRPVRGHDGPYGFVCAGVVVVR